MEYRLHYRTRYEGWFADQDTDIYLAEGNADALEMAYQRLERMKERAPAHVKGYEIVRIDHIEQREISKCIYSNG